MQRVLIDPYFCFFLILCFYLLPLNWVLSAVLAASIHEFAHYLAICLCGGKVYSLRVSLHGAIMEASPMNWWQICLCSLMGPAASLLMALLLPVLPELAVCGIGQGIYNLLPIYPLDGGRCTAAILYHLFPDSAGRIRTCLEAGCLMLLLIIGFRHSTFGLIAAGILSTMAVFRKFTCKEGNQAVQ